MMKIWPLVLTLIFSFILQPLTWAAPFNFKALQEIIDKNQCKKIEDLIPLLPEDYRKQAIFVFDSQSTQGATYEHPRVLLYGNQPTNYGYLGSKENYLVLAYAGSKDLFGYNKLEVQEFDPRTKQWLFRDIEFPESNDSSKKTRYSQVNPKRCDFCHGRDGARRPIWDTYNLWPGVIGSNDRKFFGNEKTAYQNLYRSKAGRYQHLILPEIKDDNLQGTSLDYNTFTEWVVYRNLDRTLEDIRSHWKEKPADEKYKFAMLGAVLCDTSAYNNEKPETYPIWEFLPAGEALKPEAEQAHRLTESAVLRSFYRRYQQISSQRIDKTESTAFAGDFQQVQREFEQGMLHRDISLEKISGTARLRFIVENLMGKSMIPWNHGKVRDEYTFGAFEGGPFSNLYGGQWLTLLNTQDRINILNRILADPDKTLEQVDWIKQILNQTEGEITLFSNSTAQKYRVGDLFCRSLKRVSLTAFSQ